MDKLKIAVLLIVLLVNTSVYAKTDTNSLPNEEQIQKLVAAAWKEQERIRDIDITYYKEYTIPPKPAEQIRKEVEGFFENERNMIQQTYEPNSQDMKIMLKKMNKAIEMNVNSRVKRQQFPRLIHSRVRISGKNQRVDSVTAEPGKQLDPNIPFDGTYVNVGDHLSKDFFSFHYEHKIKSAVIEDESGWVRRDPARFAHMPLGIPFLLRAGLGVNQGTETNHFFVPDANKMEEFKRTGILKISTEKFQVKITPDTNAPKTRDRTEVGPLRYSQRDVIICDKKDYSHVYHAEFRIPGIDHIVYLRDCSNFDSQGFPHNITEIQYDKDGNLKEKSVYRVIKVELNPSISAEVFEFHPPEGYKVVDHRSKKP